jgi:phosphopantothenoylcysteine synthetase/decarboxylase
MSRAPVLGLICCSAGGLESVRAALVEPLIDKGWRVAVTLTPTAATWLQANGELAALESVTGLPVRSAPRLPGEARPHPMVDGYAVVPASANTVAKMALGLGDNQALTQLCESIGNELTPIVVFPRVNAAHARQPAWANHVEALRGAGVQLVYGPEVWPLHEPRSEPGRDLPWSAILDAIEAAIPHR